MIFTVLVIKDLTARLRYCLQLGNLRITPPLYIQSKKGVKKDYENLELFFRTLDLDNLIFLNDSWVYRSNKVNYWSNLQNHRTILVPWKGKFATSLVFLEPDLSIVHNPVSWKHQVGSKIYVTDVAGAYSNVNHVSEKLRSGINCESKLILFFCRHILYIFNKKNLLW